MPHPTHKFKKRQAGYIGGGVLIILGLFGLAAEYAERKSSEDILFGYVLAGLFLIAGVLLCLASRFRYAGGVWFPLGVVLLVGAVAGATIELDDLLRNTQHQALRGMVNATVLVVSGGSCLLLGHLRHRRKCKCLPNNAA